MNSSLRSRHAELTRDLILEGSIEQLCDETSGELTMRSAAQAAGISERTIFRYFAARDELLDAVASELNLRLKAPPVPDKLDQLPAYPAAIFARFEAEESMIRAALRPEVYDRIRTGDLVQRGKRIAQLVEAAHPDAPTGLKRLTAFNIQYHVVATTWFYYRFRFGLSAADTVEAARLAIETAITGLSVDTA
jgi:AcrR family transcriptional regulator